MTKLFSTHPPIEERIKRLREYDRARRYPLRLDLGTRNCGGAAERRLGGADAGRSLRRPGPRALVVRAGAARARAYEARPPAASVSRQVHPAARRGAAGAVRPAGGTRARPVRGLGNDARAVARERPRAPSVGTSPRSTACSCGSRPRATTSSRSRRSSVDACARLEQTCPGDSPRDSPRDSLSDCPLYVSEWFAPRAAAELLYWREIAADYEHADVIRVVLARAARSARLTTHFDLDFPRAPQRGPYWCHKHKRECRPVDRAEHFLRRYALDTLARDQGVRPRPGAGAGSDRVPRRRSRAGVGRGLRCRRHLAAVSGADRLPRAASLRVRVARISTTVASGSSVPPPSGTSRAAIARLRRRHRESLASGRRRAATRARRCSSSSTTGATSTRRSSSGRGFGSRTASAAT